jgi:hypothetical protein
VNEREISRAGRWAVVILFAVLAYFGAVSFLKFLGEAFRYSDILGLPSMVSDAQAANHAARLYFCAFVVLEGLATLAIAPLFRLAEIRSKAVRLFARYAIAVVASLLATGVLVATLAWIGSRLK